ncbi:EpsG family protein [Shewanella baltica]|uniref:EpsG family protein n=1 Tax=Shewanella baltica TaxID=62322 RepID=UPI003D7C0A61
MIFYFLLTILLFFILYLASRKGDKYHSLFYFLFFFIIFLIAGLRGDVGQDTYSYQLQYDSLTSPEAFLFQLNRAEPILYFIMYPYKLIFDNFFGYTGFLLLISLLQTILLSYATKEMYHRSTFLAIYIVIIYLDYHFNVLRASLALLFFLCSLRVVNNDSKKSIVFYILALLSHFSALIFLPVLLVSFKLKPRHYIFIVGVFVGVGAGIAISFGDLINNKILGYNLLDRSSFNFPFLVFALLCFLWLTFLYNKEKSFQLIVALSVFSIAFFSSSFSDIAYRLYFISFTVLAYLTLYEKSFNVKDFRSQPHFLSIFLLCLWLGYISIKFVVQERDNRVQTGNGIPDFSFAPYSLYSDSKYRQK